MPQHLNSRHDAALRECESIALQFMAHFDARNYEEAAKLFAPDGIWHRADISIRGREDFLKHMGARPPGIFVRHVITNLLARRTDQETIRVDSYVTVYRHDFADAPVLPAALHSPDVVGRYTDVFRQIGGNWLLQEKSVSIDFKR